MSAARDRRAYGVTAADRGYVIAQKFSPEDGDRVQALLASVERPTDQVLGAILFLASPGRVDEIAAYVRLARDDRDALLNAATVKDERGWPSR